MTIAESYRQYQQGKINKAQFMQRARADRQLKNFMTNVMSFDDTVKVLKNKNIISEANTFELMPAEIRKGINFELGLTYEPIPNWINPFDNEEAVKKATKKVMKNLEKDSLYYTKLIATGVKPSRPEPETEIEYKESNLSDTTNKTKADGYLKKELKKDEDANVQTSLSKSEAKKGKPEGVQQLKEGLRGEKFYSRDYVAQKYGPKAKEIEANIEDEEDSNPNIWDLYTSLETPEETDDFVQGYIDEAKKGLKGYIKEDFSKLEAMMNKVADEWGRDSDLYSDLQDAIVGWSDRNGNLSPKGILAIKNLLSNWDVLDDYEQFLNDNNIDLHPGNMGDEMSAPTSMEEDAVQEATVPENIKKFAKSRGVLPLVNQVARWAEKAGKGIRGGTAIGKNYSTLVLDLSYQDGAIHINTDNDTITVYDEPVNDYASFINALNQANDSGDTMGEEFRPGVDLGRSFEKFKNSLNAEDEFEKLMQHYDWYYEMSDDPRHFTAGSNVDDKLKSLAKIIGAHKAIEIFNRYAPQDRKATPMFFTEMQKREKIKEAIKKHVIEAIKYTVGTKEDEQEHEYRKSADPEFEKKLKDAGVPFTKKNIS